MVALVVALVGVADADSLRQRKDRAAEQHRADEEVAVTNTRCKSAITWTFDWSTWKESADEAGHHASASCGLALAGINALCTDHIAQEAIATQLKTISCLGDADQKASVVYAAGTLTVKTSLVETKGDITDLTKAALQQGLK